MGNKGNYLRLLTYITQFAINMIVPIGLCSFLGYMIDRKLNTSVFFIILFFVGAIAGGRNIYILAKREMRNDTACKGSRTSSKDKRGAS